MKEYMIAILEENDKAQRTVGFSDTDVMEIFEQSSEIMQLNEGLGKRANFKDVVKFMIQKALQSGGQPSGGGGCCGDDGPVTPDSYISDQMPKLTESVLDILSADPFNGKNSLKIGENTIKFKGEGMLMSTLDFVRRVKGVKLLEKRKITMSAPTKPVKSGASFDVTVRAEKHAFVKEAHGTRKRIYVGLSNLSDNTMTLQVA